MDVNEFFHFIGKTEVIILAVGAGIAVLIGTLGVAIMMVLLALDHTFTKWRRTLRQFRRLLAQSKRSLVARPFAPKHPT